MGHFLTKHQTLDARVRSHRAIYHAVSKQRWSVFQRRVLHFWQQYEDSALRSRKAFTLRYYLPTLKSVAKVMGEDISVLEIGSGPVCAAQYIKSEQQTYVDPLLDDFRRLYPNKMPECANYVTSMAEKVELDHDSYDLILCLNTLSDVHNPELVLNKVEQLLSGHGKFIVSIDLWPSWLARAHYFLSRFAPTLPNLNRPYSYTYRGIYNTLSRHFYVQSSERLGSKLTWLSMRREFIFVCKAKEKSTGSSR